MARPGRINGTQGLPNGGRTNGAGVRPPAARFAGRSTSRRRAGATVALGLLLFASLGSLLTPAGSPAFAVDGSFGEWEGMPAFAGSSQGAEPVDLARATAIHVKAHEMSVFFHASFDRPLFTAQDPEALRIFVDTDGDASTGFDMGPAGAELMVEAVGRDGEVTAAGTFIFDASRSNDDWNGWLHRGAPRLAVRADQMEGQAMPVPDSARARVLVTTSSPAGDARPPWPAVPGGALAVTPLLTGATVLPAATTDLPLAGVALVATGAPQTVSTLAFVPTGGADFGAVAQLALVGPGGVRWLPRGLEPSRATFLVDPPVVLRADQQWNATLSATFERGFAGQEGLSLGAHLDAAEGSQVVLHALASPPPPAYLGFVSPEPVVDGAFGEWGHFGAQGEPASPDSPPGLDLLGTRAAWGAGKGAFFAETRGPALQGTELRDLPVSVREAVALRPEPAGAAASAPRPPAPPRSANDRLFVYIDSDRDPNTGFQPLEEYPLGAEYVIQVAGRFSRVTAAHLLAFAGGGSQESAWVARGQVRAVASGPAVEGEIPVEAVFASQGARLLFQTVSGTSRSADFSTALQEVDARGVDPDGLLHFRMVTFDPLKGEPPVRQGLSTAVASGYWVVQFETESFQGAPAAVESLGVTLFGYVHSSAYLAKFSPDIRTAVEAMPGVRWVGIYQPAYKFATDPAAWPDGPLLLDALLFEPDASLAKGVGSLGGVVTAATGHAARIAIDHARAEELAAIPSIQFLAVASGRAPTNDLARKYQGVNSTFDALGLDGSGIVVGISDTGLDFTHPAFDDTGTSGSGPNFDGRVLGYYRYGSNYGDTNGHGTHTAGSVAGDGDLSNTTNASGISTYQFRGAAPAAALVVTASLAGTPPSDDQVFADQQVFGATVSSNSWGYINAQQNPITDYEVGAYLTDLSVIDANTSRPGLQPMTIVFAAGNDGAGSNTVGSPGTAKNVITVGASEADRGYNDYSNNALEIASFSSRGPTDDARIKPDVVAVGTYILSAQSRSSGCSCTYGGWDQSWTGPNYAYSSGTSQATPHVSGIVALIQQHVNDTYARIPSPALVKAALVNGAQDLGYGYEYTGGVTGPMSQGWGRVNVTRSISGPPGGTILYVEEGPSVGNGDVVVHRFAVSSPSTPLKVTLVWTDAPGNPQDTTTLAELVNDLDLVVRAPNGTFYHGNQFSGAWSRANNSSFDRRNNVENVFVEAPSTGVWVVEAQGSKIRSATQRFALAVSGALEELAPAVVADEATFPGAPAGSKFGWNVTVGSVNGDAYADIIVGAPGADGGNGSVYLFFGAFDADASNLAIANASVVLHGGAAEAFGWDVDASGDFDGDGTPDLLVGAPGAGKAYLYRGMANWSGRTANITFAGAASDRFAESVLLVDGLDASAGAEAAIGAPLASTQAGRVFVFTGGGASGNLTTSDAGATLTGEAAGSLFGSSLAAGDMNGDGDGDLGVGSPGNAKAHALLGGVALGSLAVDANFSGIPGTRFGHAVSLEGDVNADGFADLIVGAPLSNGSAGAGHIFFGEPAPTDDQVTRYYFFDDMESGAGKWTEMSGSSNASTAWGLTTAVFYGEGATGTAWQDSSGPYANLVDISIRMTTPLNLSSASSPVFSFVYRGDVEAYSRNWDGFDVEYTTNGGSTWLQVDPSNTQGFYDAVVYDQGNPNQKSALAGLYAFTYDRPVWQRVTFNVSSLAGQSSVAFRFRFASDYVETADGVYIDDVEVRERSPSSPNFTVYGDARGDRLGTSVAALPSASGASGVFDFAMGAPYADRGFTTDAGAAYVFTGGAGLNGSATAASAAAASRGTSAGAGAGWSVHGIQGFNGSSAVRIFVGAPLAGGNQGGALVGDVTQAIPELSDLLGVALAVAAVALVSRRRRQPRNQR